jgi:hypothetical protein
MAVSEQTPYIEYTANGVTTSFALEFDCSNKDHLIVLVDDLEPAVGAWSLVDGSVNFSAAPAFNKKITIKRNTPVSRSTNFQSFNNSFRPDTLNKDLDSLWLKLQELGVADMLLRIYVDRLHLEQEDYIDAQDEIIKNIIFDLRYYVSQKDSELSSSINELRGYVNQQDNNQKLYFEDLIDRQGVSLQQLEGYYIYLMRRIAAIAVDNGWDSSFVAHNGETQYLINERQFKKNAETISTSDYGSVGDGTRHTIREWFLSGKYPSLDAIKIKYPHATSLDNSIDWVAAQKAANIQNEYDSIKIIGCLFFQEGEKLILKKGQRLYGLNENWFLNTNYGSLFQGSLTGNLPSYGIYYDGESGAAIRAPEAVVLSGFHLFGKGYKVIGTNISHANDAELYGSAGIEVEKFIITNNFSAYYFDIAIKSLAGNFYSRFYNTEITRCRVAYQYEGPTYAQSFYGCTIRNVPTPFVFYTAVKLLNYFGGSIEGFCSRNTGSVLIPGNTKLVFWGTYFETFTREFLTKSVFKFTGGNSLISFNDCEIYLNHFEKFIDQSGIKNCTIGSSSNEFILSSDTSYTTPVVYNINVSDPTSSYHLDGSDFIRSDDLYPDAATTGSIVAGSKTLTLLDSSGVGVGTKLIISGAGIGGNTLTSSVKDIVGSTFILRDAAKATVSGSIVKKYWTPQYIQYSAGISLAQFNIKFPKNYLRPFNNVDFDHSGKVIKSISEPPGTEFNGGNEAVAIYVADYANWNPANKKDGRGAYIVSLRGGKYQPMTGSIGGTFTMSTTTTKVVSDSNVSGFSRINIMPTNLEAATLYKNGMYVSAKSNGVGFSVIALTNPTGTETFDYTFCD